MSAGASAEIEYVLAIDSVTGEQSLFEHDEVPEGWVPSCRPFRMDDIELDVNSNGESRSTAPRTGWVDQLCQQLKGRSWADVLKPLGFAHHHDRDGVSYWTRPGKDKRRGHSVTTNHHGNDRMIVFSSAMPPSLQAWDGSARPPSYDRLDVIAAYEYDGDRVAAARAIRDRQQPRNEPIDNGGGPPLVALKRWSISELLAADLTYQWDIYNMVVRPTAGLDTGELKTLKTTIAQARHIGLAAGVPVLGHWVVPERRRVLCFVAEGGRVPYTRRLIRLCEAHGIDVHDLDGWLETIYDAAPLDSTTFRDSLRGHLSEFRPAFVQLDPLYPFQPMSVDSNKLAQVGLMLNEVQAICAEHEATLWITMHMNQTGSGFDLKRIAGAGAGEWADSWCLLRHREAADVERGRFRLRLDIGSRQWGGAEYDVDLDIGRFDADKGAHDGPITFNVASAMTTTTTVDGDDDKRLLARRAVFKTMRHARTALTRTEIEERSTGVAKTYIRAEIAVLIDDGGLVADGTRRPAQGGQETSLYVLAEGWRDD